jgi:hypothetical protein
VAKATIYAGGVQYTARVADAQGRRDIHRAVDAALDEMARQRGPRNTGPQPEVCAALIEICRAFGCTTYTHNKRHMWIGPREPAVISGFAHA